MKNLITKMRASTLLILGALALAAQALLGGRSTCVAANTWDNAVKTNLESVRRTNDAAITTRHLLYKEGATPGTTCAVNGAADKPLGVIDNTETSTAVVQTLRLLGRGSTLAMVASEEIAVGADIYTAANGKVQDEPAVAGTYYKVGRALTGSTADGQLIEVETHPPIRTQVVANAADLTALKAALTAPSLVKFLQS